MGDLHATQLRKHIVEKHLKSLMIYDLGFGKIIHEHVKMFFKSYLSKIEPDRGNELICIIKLKVTLLFKRSE